MYTIFSLEVLKKLAEVLNCSVNDLDEDIHFNTNEQEDNVINIPKEYTDKYKVTSRDKKQYQEEMKKANEAFFLHDHTFYQRGRFEIEANKFAAELLIDERQIEKSLFHLIVYFKLHVY